MAIIVNKISTPEEDSEWSDSSKSAGNNDRVAPRGGSGDSPATSRSSRASEPMPADGGSLNTTHGTAADVAADADRNDNAVPGKQKPSASNKNLNLKSLAYLAVSFNQRKAAVTASAAAFVRNGFMKNVCD